MKEHGFCKAWIVGAEQDLQVSGLLLHSPQEETKAQRAQVSTLSDPGEQQKGKDLPCLPD